MAHHKSAQKRIRRNQRRYEINHARKSRVRTFIKKVEREIAKGDKTAAEAALARAAPELRRAANKGTIHPNAVARKVSRLHQRVKAIG